MRGMDVTAASDQADGTALASLEGSAAAKSPAASRDVLPAEQGAVRPGAAPGWPPGSRSDATIGWRFVSNLLSAQARPLVGVRPLVPQMVCLSTAC